MFARDAFARNGLRPYTSPAEQVIADFVARGITVDELYVMLGGMDAWGCMAVVEQYGKASIESLVHPPSEVPVLHKQCIEHRLQGWSLCTKTCN